MNVSAYRSLLDRFTRLKTLVIGDLMLDHYVWGSVGRISPEAPVPIVDVSRETEMPGGAGNVAVNMASLGSEIFLVGTLGQDAAADRLTSLFHRGPIRTDACVRTSERPTILKTRIVAQHQQVVRVDREIKGELPLEIKKQLWAHIEKLLPDVHSVVLSDYGKGVVSRSLIKELIPAAKKRGIPVTVDPKIENFKLYKHVTCITPNLQEAMEGTGTRSIQSEEDLNDLGTNILSDLQSESVLITRGEKGMSLFERKKPPLHIPTRAREVYDVTGAGDTVISVLTLALAAGAPLRTAAEMANYAAGIVVGKLGTASVTSEELLHLLRNSIHG